MLLIILYKCRQDTPKTLYCAYSKHLIKRYFLTYLFPQAETYYSGDCHTQNKSLEY